MTVKTAKVAAADLALAEKGDERSRSPWFAALAEVPTFRLLDAYQLIKHYLGLTLTYRERKLTLVVPILGARQRRLAIALRGAPRRDRAIRRAVADDATCTFQAVCTPQHWRDLDELSEKPPGSAHTWWSCAGAMRSRSVGDARDPSREASELLTGAERKVAITQYHARELTQMLDDSSPYDIAVQAHFEGLVYAGTSAEEKLAISLDVLAGSGTDKDTKRLARWLLEREEMAELGDKSATGSGAVSVASRLLTRGARSATPRPTASTTSAGASAASGTTRSRIDPATSSTGSCSSSPRRTPATSNSSRRSSRPLRSAGSCGSNRPRPRRSDAEVLQHCEADEPIELLDRGDYSSPVLSRSLSNSWESIS